MIWINFQKLKTNFFTVNFIKIIGDWKSVFLRIFKKFVPIKHIVTFFSVCFSSVNLLVLMLKNISEKASFYIRNSVSLKFEK